ncbi:MAG: glycosyltransferase family 4 protein [Planctomycetota bacterium]
MPAGLNIAITSMYLPTNSKIGVGYQVHHFANALVRRGHRVTVFSMSDKGDDALYDVEVVPHGSKLRTFQFCWNLRRVDFTRFDVLNAHGDDWFLWLKRLPRHVHTYHGSCFAEMLHSKTWAGRVRFGALAALEYGSCFLANELVTVSRNTTQYIPMVKRVIPCGVNLDAFAPGDKAEAPTLLFVGTMRGRKRGAMLLEKFQQDVRSKVPDARLWCVCEEEVSGDGVEWFGRVDFETLVDLYRRAWVFALPSTYEGFGVPYIEAMASGTAVVATPNPGSLEVTRDGQDGLVVEDGQLGSTIAALLTDAAERDRLVSAGLRRSRDFGWDRVCAAYEALYRDERVNSQGALAS